MCMSRLSSKVRNYSNFIYEELYEKNIESDWQTDKRNGSLKRPKNDFKLYLDGWASWLPTTAAILGFRLSPTGGWVTSAPKKITGSLNTFKKQTFQQGYIKPQQINHNPFPPWRRIKLWNHPQLNSGTIFNSTVDKTSDLVIWLHLFRISTGIL